MSNIIDFDLHPWGVDLIERFEEEDKIQEFNELVKCNNLKDKYVVIVLPSIDGSQRSIFKDNKELYDSQQRDADILAKYIMINRDADLVTVATGIEQINSLMNSYIEKVDYVIFLHKFIASERNMINEVFANNDVGLKHLDLN